MSVSSWVIIIIVLVAAGAVYYAYSNPSIMASISSSAIGNSQAVVSIPNLQANTTSYLNKTFSVRAILGQRIEIDAYYQAGIQYAMSQYISSNQTQWYFPLRLPNQPNRQWQVGSSYLFTGHLSTLYECHTIFGKAVGGGTIEPGAWSISQNSTCWDNVTPTQYSISLPQNTSGIHCISVPNSAFPGGMAYTCFPLYPAQVQYYFDATNATLNG